MHSEPRADSAPRAGVGVLANTPWLALFATLPSILAIADAAALLVAANSFFMAPPTVLQPWDEGYALAFARRLIEGRGLPYVDAISHRGPLFYWVVAGAVRIFGFGTWAPMRALSLVTMVLTLAIGAAAAWLARRRLAAAIMALAYTAICVSGILGVMPAYDGLALNAEHVMNVFSVTALASMTIALRPGLARPALGWVAAAGAALMLAGLSKQVSLVALLPFSLWITAATFARDSLTRRDRTLVLGVFAAATLAPLAAVLLVYARAGELRTFLYWAMTYNSKVYAAAVIGKDRDRFFHSLLLDHPDLLLPLAGLLGWGAARALGLGRSSARDLARQYASRGFEATVGLMTILSFAASNATMRSFGHYYLQAVPWACLLGGLAVEGIAGRPLTYEPRHPLRAAVAPALVLLPLAAVTHLLWSVRLTEFRADLDGLLRRATSASASPACQFIDAHTSPNDAIFVWGFDPVPYTACNRRPASRYVFTTFQAGIVPWVNSSTDEEASRVVPGSVELLLGDLRESMPAVILDSAQTMMGHSMLDVAPLREFVEANYCRQDEIYSTSLWARRPSGGCTPSDGHAARRPLHTYWSRSTKAAQFDVAARASHEDSLTASTDDAARDAARGGYLLRTTPGWDHAGAVFVEPFPGTVPLKLFYSELTRDYFLTATPEGELSARSSGYGLSRIEGYVFPADRPGTLPLKLFYNPRSHDSLTTASDDAVNTALSAGYVFIRVEAFVPSD